MPVPFAARRTVSPDGLPAAAGSVHVEPVAHRAVIEIDGDPRGAVQP